MKDPFLIKENSFRGNVIRNYSQSSQEGGAEWLAGNARAGSLGLSVPVRRINYFLIVLSSLICVLVSYSFYLQIAKGDYYRKVAEGNRIRIKTVKAARGVIYDRNGELLAKNVPNFYLAVTPADLPRDPEDREKTLANLFLIADIPMSRDELEAKIKKFSSYSYEPLAVKDQIGYEEAVSLKIKSEGLPGISLETLATREYADGPLLAHLLGYSGKITEQELKNNDSYLLSDYIGKTGLELSYEDVLKGADGKRRVEVDARGTEKKMVGSQDPKPGDNLVLSIDEGLQRILSDALKDTMGKNRSAGKAAAIAIDPRNGEVLAMVNIPQFDNNLFARGISSEDYQKLVSNPTNPLFPRAVSGEYPPGSTFKLVMSSAALQEGIITPATTFSSTGGIRISEWFFPDWKAGGHGITNVTKALAESINTFFYIIGGGLFDITGKNELFPGMGLDNIIKYAAFFGLGEKSGIDLPGERPGFLPTAEWKQEAKGEQWYVGDTYHLSIGQGDLLVTPLQVADFTAAVANGGTLYQPYLVRERTDSKGNVIKKTEPTVIRSGFIDLKNLETVRRGLRQAVTEGSARGLSSLPFEVAAKTGTAQPGGNKNPHAWITCFAPYENPEIVITILIEEGGEGSTTAVPVAREALQWYFSHKNSESNN